MDSLSTNQRIPAKNTPVLDTKIPLKNAPLIPKDNSSKGGENSKAPFAREKLYDSFRDFATAKSDNTRVAINPRPISDKPAAKVSSDIKPSELKLEKPEMPKREFNTARVDNTRTVVREKPVKSKQKSPQQAKVQLPPPRQTYLRQAPPRDPVNEAYQRKQQKYREMQEKLNKNYNMMCQADPVSSQINGHYNFGTDQNPNWSKIGPSPLEGTAMIYATFNPVTSTALTGLSVGSAIKDPTPYNIASAGLAVTGSMGSMLKTAGQAGQFLKTTNTAQRVLKTEQSVMRATNTLNRISKAEQSVARVSNAAGNVDRVNTGVQVLGPNPE